MKKSLLTAGLSTRQCASIAYDAGWWESMRIHQMSPWPASYTPEGMTLIWSRAGAHTMDRRDDGSEGSLPCDDPVGHGRFVTVV